MKIKFFSIFLFIFSLHFFINAQELDSQFEKSFYGQRILGTAILDHIKTLASDQYEGRELGTPGYDKAVNYVIDHLKSYGINPHPTLGTYTQEFGLTTVSWSKFQFKIWNNNSLRTRFDFIPFHQEVQEYKIFKSRKISFLGYGSDSDLNIAAKGKIGLLLLKGDSEINEQELDVTRLKAKLQGIEILLVVHPDFESIQKEYRSSLSLFENFESDPRKSSIIYISEYYSKMLLETIEEDLKAYRAGKEFKKLPIIKYSVSIANQLNISEPKKSKNVIGFIEGTDPKLKNEIVVVSAHLDHIGKKSETMIFNGADDNGSGSSTLIELAKNIQKMKSEDYEIKRSVMFVWFAGEEKGLLGSRYFVTNPFLNLSDIKIDLNVDMIGRIDKLHHPGDNYIYIIGVDKINPDLLPILNNVNSTCCQIDLDYRYNDENDPNRFYYRSDHYNFARNGIPVIFYFSGVHDDYHRETDTFEKIDVERLQNRARLIFHTLLEMITRKEYSWSK